MSRWVALVEKRTQDAGEVLSDKPSAVDVSHTTGAQSLREGLPPLDLATIKDFLRFIASVSEWKERPNDDKSRGLKVDESG